MYKNEAEKVAIQKISHTKTKLPSIAHAQENTNVRPFVFLAF